MASVMYSGEGTSRQRLSYPKLFTGDDWVETNWDHALKDEDSEVADTLFYVGANGYETQTNYFLAHAMPNMTGLSIKKKQESRPTPAVSTRPWPPTV